MHLAHVKLDMLRISRGPWRARPIGHAPPSRDADERDVEAPDQSHPGGA
jgi:hypothetical protein